jgi:hypothetical protein
MAGSFGCIGETNAVVVADRSGIVTVRVTAGQTHQAPRPSADEIDEQVVEYPLLLDLDAERQHRLGQ